MLPASIFLAHPRGEVTHRDRRAERLDREQLSLETAFQLLIPAPSRPLTTFLPLCPSNIFSFKKKKYIYIFGQAAWYVGS